MQNPASSDYQLGINAQVSEENKAVMNDFMSEDLASGARGQRFESSRAYHPLSKNQPLTGALQEGSPSPTPCPTVDSGEFRQPIGLERPRAVVVPLSGGYFAWVDEDDYERVSQFKWSHHTNGVNHYALRQVNSRPVYLHRFVMNAPEGVFIDHRDNDGLNNCKWNLRVCSRKQNNRNRKTRSRKTSDFKGVDLRAGGRWRAKIRVDGKSIHIGLFATQEEAARAYDVSARKHFGEFACCNFPEVRA